MRDLEDPFLMGGASRSARTTRRLWSAAIEFEMRDLSLTLPRLRLLRKHAMRLIILRGLFMTYI